MKVSLSRARVLLVPISCFCLGSFSFAESKVKNSLPTNEEELRAGWEWIRLQDGGYEFQEEALRIKSLPGNIWGGGKASNILVRALEGESVCITAKVSLKPEVHGEQAGLMLYLDDDNYCKIVYEWFGKLSTTTIVTARESEGKAKPLKILPFADEAVVLRLVRLEEQVLCFAKGEKEETFTLLTHTKMPTGSDEPAQLALYSSGAKKETDHWATFHTLEVQSISADADALSFLKP